MMTRNSVGKQFARISQRFVRVLSACRGMVKAPAYIFDVGIGIGCPDSSLEFVGVFSYVVPKSRKISPSWGMENIRKFPRLFCD